MKFRLIEKWLDVFKYDGKTFELHLNPSLETLNKNGWMGWFADRGWIDSKTGNLYMAICMGEREILAHIDLLRKINEFDILLSIDYENLDFAIGVPVQRLNRTNKFGVSESCSLQEIIDGKDKITQAYERCKKKNPSFDFEVERIIEMRHDGGK